jgi:hypothetical protein
MNNYKLRCIIDDVFEKYAESEQENEHKDEIEICYNKLFDMLDDIDAVKDFISSKWDDDTVFVGEIRNLISS